MRQDDHLIALHVTDPSDRDEQLLEQLTGYYQTECDKLQDTIKGCTAVLKTVLKTPGPISSDIVTVADKEEADLLIMGTVELSKLTKKHKLGSVALAVAKESSSHFCVVKNTSLV